MTAMVRIKQRYLLLNILYPEHERNVKTTSSSTPIFQKPTANHVNAGLFMTHLKSQINLLFGDYGLGVSLSSLKVVYFSSATSTAIIRVPRSHHRLVWAALSHVTELPPPRKGPAVRAEPCVIRVVRVSGTIRKAEEELIRRAKRDVVRAKLSTEKSSLPWPSLAYTTSGVREVDSNVTSIEDDSDGDSHESDQH